MGIMARQVNEGYQNQETTPKEWFMTCCRNMSEKVSQAVPKMENINERPPFIRKNIQRLVNLVITPTTVPDFTIPKSYGKPLPDKQNSQCEDFICSELGSQTSLERETQFSSWPGTPMHSPIIQKRHLSEDWRRSSSEPASPVHPSKGTNFCSFKRSHTISYDIIDEKPEATTNADPRSRAAMSLPHLKTKTKFGFETLTECPKTRRKESLFHGLHYGVGKSVNRGRKGFLNQNRRVPSEDTLVIGSEHQKRTSSKRRNVTSMVKPLGVTMSPQDSFDNVVCPSQNSRSPSRTSLDRCSLVSESDEGSPPSLTSRRKRFMSRRPASINHEELPSFLVGKDKNCSIPRQGSYNDISLHQEELMQLWRISALTSTCGVTSYPPVASEMPQLQAAVIPRTEYNGELKFKVSYDADNLELTVHLMEGINLGKSNHGSDPVNSFVKLYLHPSGVQRFTSCLVKQNNDPVFDQSFTFSNVTREDLRSVRLSMTLLNRERLLRKNELLGEVVLDLSDLDFEIVTCHELVREVEAEQIPQEIGRLQVLICFRANKQKLDVTLLKIKDLPRHPITGAPDTYISLELRQPGRPDVCLQSKIKKKVIAATFDETFSFDISPKIEDLNYTCLTLTVFEREIILSDRIIGEVRLGFGATEESEFEHWNLVLNTPSKDFQMWHMLMEEN